jgi:hypothetical protein
MLIHCVGRFQIYNHNLIYQGFGIWRVTAQAEVRRAPCHFQQTQNTENLKAY